MSTISENTVAESAIGDNSVNQGQYIFDFEVVGLELSATDNQSEGIARQADGALVYDHFRPAVRAVVEDTGVVFVSASTSVVNISSINNTATFTYGDFDSIYEFNGLILEFQDDYPGLPIGPISVNAVGEIQYIGPQNFVPGLLELSIGVSDNVIKSISRITQGALTLSAQDNDDGSSFIRAADGATIYPHFRPAIRMEVSDVADTTLGAFTGNDTAYLFANPGIDRLERAAGLPILPISVNAIGTLQYEGVMDYQPSIGNLAIAGSSDDVKSVQRITTGALEISATDNQGPGVVRISDGKLEYPHFRPVLEVERSYVTELIFGVLGSNPADAEYNNGAISNVTGNGSDFFKREVTVNGVRIVAAGTVGGQTAVPDAWLEKVARMFELFLDKDAAGINETAQRNVIKTLRGDAGTYHAAQGPTLQRVARGAGSDYTPNFLTDEGIASWNLSPLFDTHVANDMVWYLNSTGDGYGDGEIDAQEVIEHVFHTLHMHGLDAVSLKMYPFISADWATGPLYAAMVEAYDGGFWDPSGYGGANFKTDSDAFEVAAKEYLYLLNFSMFEYTGLWDGDSLAPEWTDTVRTSSQIQTNLPLGYALFNSYIAPVISKPSLATINSIFGDGNTPAQDDPALAGVSGYVVDVLVGGNDTAYFFASDGIDRLERYAGLPISPIGVNAIGTLQYEGVMDYQPSIGELIVSDNDAFANIAVIVDTTTLAIGVDWNDGPGVVRDSDGKLEYPYFRPSLEVDVENIPFKTLAASSVEYKFENSIAYQTLTGAGLPIGPISYSAISEEQQIAGALASFFDFTDIIPLTINAVGVLDTNRQEYEFFDITTISLDSTGIVVANYPRIDTVVLEVSAVDTINKKFVYVDTLLFSVGQPSDIISISSNRDITPLVIRGTTSVNQSYTKIETVNVSVDTLSQNNTIRQYPITVVANSISATDNVDVVYKPRQGKTPVKVFKVNNAYRVSDASTYDYILELDTISNAALVNIVDSFNLATNQSGYALNDNEVYITFYKQGTIQHAIRHLAFSQTNLGTRSFYNYNKPRAQSNIVNSVQRIVLDTDPRMLSWNAANFDNISYNLTTSSFEFDEIRYYQGDPANNNELLLWTATIGTDLQVEVTTNVLKSALIPAQFVPLEIDLTDDYFASYKVLDDNAEFEIAANFIQTNRYKYTDVGSFIKGGASGIVTTLGSIDTTPLVISDNDTFEILYNFALDTIALQISDDSFSLLTANIQDLTNLELYANEIFNRTYDRAIGNAELEIGETHLSSIIRNYVDTSGLEIGETHLSSIIRNYVDTSGLEIGETHLSSIIRNYVDTAAFAQLGVDSLEISFDYDTVVFNAFAATDSVEQMFVFDDTAAFAQLGVDSLEISFDYDTVVFNAFAATDSVEQMFVFDDIIGFEITASSPEIVSEASTLEIEINVLQDIKQQFVFDDTAVFAQLGATSVEITFNKETTLTLEITATDAVSQIYNFVDNTEFRTVVAFDNDIIFNVVSNVTLEISDEAENSVAYNYSNFTIALESSASSTEENTFTFTDVEPLEIDAVSVVSRAFVFDDTATFVQLGATDTSFTTNSDSIVELEIDAESQESILLNYVDVANLGVVTIGDQQIIYEFVDVEFVSFDSTTEHNSTLNSIETTQLEAQVETLVSRTYAIPVTTLELELDGFDNVSKTFAFDDTAEFGLLAATDSEFIYNFENVEFVAFGATDDVDIIYNITSVPAVDIGDNTTQSSTRQYIDEVNFVTFVAASSEILVNIENEGILGFGVSDDIDIVYNFQPQAFIETTAFDDITQSVSRRTTAPLNIGSITNQYYYTKFKQIYANDTIEFKLKGDSNEMKITGAVESTGPKQIWIG